MTWAPWSSHGVTMGIKHLIMPTAPGPRANKVCVGGTRPGGGEITSNELRVTSNPKGGKLITRDYDHTRTGAIVTIALESVFVTFLGCYMHIGGYIT